MKKLSDKTKKTFRKSLGASIKEHREAAGISQYKLAGMIGSTQTRIPEIERGDAKSIDTYLACITVLGGQIRIEWAEEKELT